MRPISITGQVFSHCAPEPQTLSMVSPRTGWSWLGSPPLSENGNPRHGRFWPLSQTGGGVARKMVGYAPFVPHNGGKNGTSALRGTRGQLEVGTLVT